MTHAGVQHREDFLMSEGEAEKHHQVALLIDKAPDKADDKVMAGFTHKGI